MCREIRVLVDGVGGDVGQGVLKSLLDTELDIKLYASCISDTSSWLYKIENSYIFPLVSQDSFIDFLIDFLIENKIDIYFPTVDSALLKISEYKNFIESKTNVKIFIDILEKIRICDDKFLTNKFLIDNNFDAPRTISMENILLDEFLLESKYPLILKTKSGNGAKNVMKINSLEELKPFIGNSAWLLQEFLDIENEITSGIYLGNDEEIKGIYILKRTLRSGSTHHAERIIDKNLEEQLISIARKMNMKYLNIQAVYKDNKVLPFEFNGRLSGTTGAMRQIFNVPEIFIRENILNQYIEPTNNIEKIYFTRYNEEIIYTEEDLNKLIKRSSIFGK